MLKAAHLRPSLRIVFEKTSLKLRDRLSLLRTILPPAFGTQTMAEAVVNPGAYRSLHAEKGAQSDLKLCGSWFCPFVQRAWIALEEKKVEYEYLEIDPYAKVSCSLQWRKFDSIFSYV
jgi:hypothetical protein